MNVKIAFSIWIAMSIASFAAVAYDLVETERRLGLIMNDPGMAVGQWTLKDCSNHGSRQFTFVVDQIPYHGSGGPGDPACDPVKLGADVKVAYERANPANNFAGLIEDIPRIIEYHKISFVMPALFSLGAFFLIVLPHRENR